MHFTSSYIPITRGILAICHCFPVRPVTREEALAVYREFYRDEFFVRVFDMPRDPAQSMTTLVAGANSTGIVSV